MSYTTIAKRFEEALQTKTSWGKNEVLNLLKDILLQTADDELQSPVVNLTKPLWSPPSLVYDDDDIPF